MKKLALAGAMALALSMGGCAELDNAVNSAVNWIDSPKTQQAIGSIKSVSTALVCAVASTSAVAGEIESGLNAGSAMIGTDGKVYVASATICAALGGTVGTTVPVAQIPTN